MIKCNVLNTYCNNLVH